MNMYKVMTCSFMVGLDYVNPVLSFQLALCWSQRSRTVLFSAEVQTHPYLLSQSRGTFFLFFMLQAFLQQSALFMQNK